MLIASISGIRGTLGNDTGNDLTREDVRAFVASYAALLARTKGKKKVVVGRDARESGVWIKREVIDIFTSFGMDVYDLDLATTPTVEMAVPFLKAHAGVIISASHNPIEWNGLKFLNEKGELVAPSVGERIIRGYKKGETVSKTKKKGKSVRVKNALASHIHAILKLPLVDSTTIRKQKFVAVVDGVNSIGGVAIPRLLKSLGVKVIEINCEPTGRFAHVAEPLPENLGELGRAVKNHKADIGIAVDPDADRLVFFDENGNCVGEEYTLILAADYVLSHKGGNAVSNLSSSRALADLARAQGGKYFASPVGLVNVVAEMKKRKALIGGEGNGGVIYAPLHYGRDSLIGVALVLSLMAERGQSLSELRNSYASYFMAKDKISFQKIEDRERVIEKLLKQKIDGAVDRRDGIKIDFADSWVHLRKSNTEPIIRIYTEAKSKDAATALADSWKKKLTALI